MAASTATQCSRWNRRTDLDWLIGYGLGLNACFRLALTVVRIIDRPALIPG